MTPLARPHYGGTATIPEKGARGAEPAAPSAGEAGGTHAAVARRKTTP